MFSELKNNYSRDIQILNDTIMEMKEKDDELKNLEIEKSSLLAKNLDLETNF